MLSRYSAVLALLLNTATASNAKVQMDFGEFPSRFVEFSYLCFQSNTGLLRAGSERRRAVFAALCSAQAALAQDSQLPPVPFYDWTGVYVGANLGYASANINNTTTSGGTSTSSSQTMTGVIGGGQLSANFQYAHTVFGVEVDAQASSQKTSSMPSFATARARLGYAYDRIHYYVTGIT
jgi:hypothetical protein